MKVKYSRFFFRIAIPCMGVWFHLYYGLKIIGRENVPEGGCIICPNHTSAADPPLAGVAMTGKVQMRSMAKKELFHGLGGRAIGWLGGFPVDREGTDLTAIKTALQTVKDGKKLLIFPQGTRDAKEGETKKGAAMLAVKTKAPIVPMYISEDKHFRSHVKIVIGKPFYPEAGQKDYGIIADDILKRIYDLKEQA